MALLGGANILGGVLQGSSAQKAAQQSAQAQLEAARIAADAARFRPVALSTYALGSSDFQRDAQGNVIGATYTSTPELRGYQQQLSALGGQQLQEALGAQQQYAPLQGAAGGLFNLGQQYLAQSPEQVAQQYISRQQDLLAPSRERQYAQLQNQLFNTGRGGLSVGATGLRPSGGMGLGASSPEMEAYYNALAQQDLQLASQAQQAGQQQTAFGAGLFGTGSQLLGQYQAGQVGALSPFQTSLGLQGSIENLAMTPLQVGAELGGRSATAGANVGQALLSGGMGAARTMQAANAYNPLANVLQGAGTNPLFTQYMQPYVNAQQAIGQYGASNVYGYGGQGTVPTSVNWDI
jgi:hypothetical protein